MLTSYGALEPEADSVQVAHECWPGKMGQGINCWFGALPHWCRLMIGEDSTRINCKIKKEAPMSTMSEISFYNYSTTSVRCKGISKGKEGSIKTIAT